MEGEAEHDDSVASLENIPAVKDEPSRHRFMSSSDLGIDTFTLSHFPDPPNLEHSGLKGTMSSCALNTVWAFGMSSHASPVNLTDGLRKAVMFPSSHIGVMYDFDNKRQFVLQGHLNNISCTCLSEDKRWLITGDRGPNSTVIAWDTYTGVPIQTIFDPNPDGGFDALALNKSGSFLATLSTTRPQILAVWDWTVDVESPRCSLELAEKYSPQRHVAFSQENSHFLVITGSDQVVFVHWVDDSIKYYTPLMEKYIYKVSVGTFTTSVYQKGTTQALTATSTGLIITWDTNPKTQLFNPGIGQCADKVVKKLTPILQNSIDVVVIADPYLVLAGQDGQVVFLDEELMMVHWFQMGVGPITSLSFSTNLLKKRSNSLLLQEMATQVERTTSMAHGLMEFQVEDFVISNIDCCIIFVTNNGKSQKIVTHGYGNSVHAVATHPSRPFVVVGSYSCVVQVYNYEEKELVASRQVDRRERAGIQVLQFDRNGSFIVAGLTNGAIKFMDVLTLEIDPEQEFHMAAHPITHIAFSPCGQFMATSDASFTTSLYKKERVKVGEGFHPLGRYKAHNKPVCELRFGRHVDSDKSRLVSLSTDRCLVEYDLEKSSKDNLVVLCLDRLEQSALPTCMVWYPLHLSKESFMMTANDQYKLKLYNATSRMCRKTLLGPTYGSPLKQLIALPKPPGGEGELDFAAFATSDKIGLIMLPPDGNPHRAMTLIAHPNGVSKLVASHCGNYLFTAGGADRTVLMWETNTTALKAKAKLGGEDLEPFYGLLDGGRDGQFFADMENYFYYAQMRKQGADCIEGRVTSVSMPLSEVPDMMRALGFYPSQHQIQDMINEIKFSRYVETGQIVQELDLGHLIRLYVNHRPAFGLPLENVKWAFDILGLGSPTGSVIARGDLLDMLQNKGEHMTEYELADCLDTLLCMDLKADGVSETDRVRISSEKVAAAIDQCLPGHITAPIFIEDILGMHTEEDRKELERQEKEKQEEEEKEKRQLEKLQKETKEREKREMEFIRKKQDQEREMKPRTEQMKNAISEDEEKKKEEEEGKPKEEEEKKKKTPEE